MTFLFSLATLNMSRDLDTLQAQLSNTLKINHGGTTDDQDQKSDESEDHDCRTPTSADIKFPTCQYALQHQRRQGLRARTNPLTCSSSSS